MSCTIAERATRHRARCPRVFDPASLLVLTPFAFVPQVLADNVAALQPMWAALMRPDEDSAYNEASLSKVVARSDHRPEGSVRLPQFLPEGEHEVSPARNFRRSHFYHDLPKRIFHVAAMPKLAASPNAEPETTSFFKLHVSSTRFRPKLCSTAAPHFDPWATFANKLSFFRAETPA